MSIGQYLAYAPLVNQAATSPDPDPEPVQLRSRLASTFGAQARIAFPGELLSSWCLLDVELEQTVGLVASYTQQSEQ